MTFSNIIRENMYTLARLAGEELNGYNSQAAYNKDQYLKMGRSVLRAVAKHLDLREYKVSVNRAGIAVSGDVTLIGMGHNGKGIYIDMGSPELWHGEFMYRTIGNMKDSPIIGINQWVTYQRLADDPEGVCELFARQYS